MRPSKTCSRRYPKRGFSRANSPPDAYAVVHRCASSRSGNSRPPSSSVGTPAARWRNPPLASARRLPSALRAPAVFSDHRLQRFFVQTQIYYQPQLRLRVTQLLRSLRLALVLSTVLRLPGVECVFGHPHFSRQILHLFAPPALASVPPTICTSVFPVFDIPHSPFFRTNHTQLCAETGEPVRTPVRLSVLSPTGK